MLLRLPIVSILAAAVTSLPAAAQPETMGTANPDTAAIHLHTGGFWLNLHHFLYVLGRAEAGMADAGRDAVRGAPADRDSVLSRLPAGDQRTWRAAVAAYASGLSRLDAIHDARLVRLSHRLSTADPGVTAARAGFDPDLASVLDSAAGIYRTAWWPRHDAANRARAAALRPLLGRHEDALRDYVSRVYQASWPDAGYHIHLSAYTNWAGAYSTTGPVIVASSLDPSLNGWHGIEILVHESLHQWDEQVLARVARAARAANVSVPPYDVIHAMIFATAGEAVRRIVPDHVPYAELHGLWRGRSFAPHKARVDAAWRPWLRGEDTLEDALAALVGEPVP